jgi:ElaA protein
LSSNSKITWYCTPFSELDVITFHNIIQLRVSVFIMEQDCHYMDLDGKDLKAYHVYALNENNEVVAHARLLDRGVSYEYMSIGRVVVRKDYRGTGLGHELMQYSMNKAKEIYGEDKIKISAQQHLEKFYESHGFVTVTDMYFEDDIPHVGMLYTPN